MCVFPWMMQARLKLNPSKIENISIVSEFQRKQVQAYFSFEFLIIKQTQQIEQETADVLFENNFNFRQHTMLESLHSSN